MAKQGENGMGGRYQDTLDGLSTPVSAANRTITIAGFCLCLLATALSILIWYQAFKHERKIRRDGYVGKQMRVNFGVRCLVVLFWAGLAVASLLAPLEGRKTWGMVILVVSLTHVAIGLVSLILVLSRCVYWPSLSTGQKVAPQEPEDLSISRINKRKLGDLRTVEMGSTVEAQTPVSQSEQTSVCEEVIVEHTTATASERVIVQPAQDIPPLIRTPQQPLEGLPDLEVVHSICRAQHTRCIAIPDLSTTTPAPPASCIPPTQPPPKQTPGPRCTPSPMLLPPPNPPKPSKVNQGSQTTEAAACPDAQTHLGHDDNTEPCEALPPPPRVDPPSTSSSQLDLSSQIPHLEMVRDMSAGELFGRDEVPPPNQTNHHSTLPDIASTFESTEIVTSVLSSAVLTDCSCTNSPKAPKSSPEGRSPSPTPSLPRRQEAPDAPTRLTPNFAHLPVHQRAGPAKRAASGERTSRRSLDGASEASLSSSVRSPLELTKMNIMSLTQEENQRNGGQIQSQDLPSIESLKISGSVSDLPGAGADGQRRRQAGSHVGTTHSKTGSPVQSEGPPQFERAASEVSSSISYHSATTAAAHSVYRPTRTAFKEACFEHPPYSQCVSARAASLSDVSSDLSGHPDLPNSARSIGRAPRVHVSSVASPAGIPPMSPPAQLLRSYQTIPRQRNLPAYSVPADWVQKELPCLPPRMPPRAQGPTLPRISQSPELYIPPPPSRSRAQARHLELLHPQHRLPGPGGNPEFMGLHEQYSEPALAHPEYLEHVAHLEQMAESTQGAQAAHVEQMAQARHRKQLAQVAQMEQMEQLVHMEQMERIAHKAHMVQMEQLERVARANVLPAYPAHPPHLRAFPLDPREANVVQWGTAGVVGTCDAQGVHAKPDASQRGSGGSPKAPPPYTDLTRVPRDQVRRMQGEPVEIYLAARARQKGVQRAAAYPARSASAGGYPHHFSGPLPRGREMQQARPGAATSLDDRSFSGPLTPPHARNATMPGLVGETVKSVLNPLWEQPTGFLSTESHKLAAAAASAMNLDDVKFQTGSRSKSALEMYTYDQILHEGPEPEQQRVERGLPNDFVRKESSADSRSEAGGGSNGDRKVLGLDVVAKA